MCASVTLTLLLSEILYRCTFRFVFSYICQALTVFIIALASIKSLPTQYSTRTQKIDKLKLITQCTFCTHVVQASCKFHIKIFYIECTPLPRNFSCTLSSLDRFFGLCFVFATLSLRWHCLARTVISLLHLWNKGPAIILHSLICE